jgi:hypothetical protein
MSDDQTNTEPELDEYEKAAAAKEEAALRKATRIQLDETEKHAEAKKAQDMGSWTDEQLRRYTRKIAGYDAV